MKHLGILAVSIITILPLPSAAKWEKLNGPLVPEGIQKLFCQGNSLFALSASGIIRSTNGGDQWEKVNSGLTTDSAIYLNFSGGTLIAGRFSTTHKGTALRFSSDNGTTWSADAINKKILLDDRSVCSDAMIAEDSAGGKMVSIDGGKKWRTITSAIPEKIRSITKCGTMLLVGTEEKGIYRSSDSGATWVHIDNELSDADVGVLVTASGAVFAAGDGIDGIFRSLDNGNHWQCIHEGTYGYSVAAAGKTIVAGSNLTNFVVSTDTGTTWTPMTSGVPAVAYSKVGWMAAGEHGFYLSCESGTFKADDSTRTWRQVSTGFSAVSGIISLAGHGDTLIAGTRWHGIFRSFNRGDTWSAANDGLGSQSITSLLIKRKTFFAGTYRGMYRSTEDGSMWVPAGDFPATSGVTSMACNDTAVFALADSGLFRTLDDGGSWRRLVTGAEFSMSSVAADGKFVIIGTGTHGGGVFVSEDNGETWIKYQNSGDLAYIIEDLMAFSGKIFAITPINIIQSIDHGKTWSYSEPDFTVPSGVFMNMGFGGNAMFSGSTAGILVSMNKGEDWHPFNDGFGNVNNDGFASTAVMLGVTGDYVYASQTTDTWRRPLADTCTIGASAKPLIAGKSHVSGMVRASISGTALTVGYTLDRYAYVNAALYAPSGSRVAMISNAPAAPGVYRIHFDCRNITPGCYILNVFIDGNRTAIPLVVAR